VCALKQKHILLPGTNPFESVSGKKSCLKFKAHDSSLRLISRLDALVLIILNTNLFDCHFTWTRGLAEETG